MRANFAALIRDYLGDLQGEYERGSRSGAATPELSYRMPLDALLGKISVSLGIGDVEKIFEPRQQARAGRPDWRFHNSKSMAVYGYVEAKGLNPREDLDPSSHAQQIDKYLSLGHRLIFTDGLDFIFYEPKGSPPHKISLARKPIRKGASWVSDELDPRLEGAFKRFFAAPTARAVSNAELVKHMAAYARSIASTVYDLVRLAPGAGIDREENDAIKALQEMKALLKVAHDPDLDDDQRFSDMVAQTLVFGLLYAHHCLLGARLSPPEMAKALSTFWRDSIRKDGTNRLRPFRALASAIDGGARLGPITTWYDDCVLYLSHVKARHPDEVPNYHALYEQFLKAYAPIVREDFGAYATPHFLASYIVGFCDFVAREVFGQKTLFASGNKIIDPGCGTGQFLEECVNSMRRIGIASARAPTVAGFEILPAPYALAQYRMAELVRHDMPLASQVHAVLCNTLANHVVDARWTSIARSPASPAQRLFEEEGKEAAGLARPPITAIIGNPPSSDRKAHVDEASCGRILALVEDFRPPEADRGGRQNIQKQMQNEFVKFLRWACHKIPQEEPSIVAFILPGSLLYADGYEHARRWLARNFADIWVMEFDSDLRTGVAAENLFATRQSRTVLICSREKAAEKSVTVRYLSVLDRSRDEKEKYFSKETSRLLKEPRATIERDFETLSVAEPNFRFRPQAAYDTRTYSRFWNLVVEDAGTGIFLRHSSGLKLGITAALVHFDRDILLRRAKAIGDPQASYESLITRWFDKQQKPPTETALNGRVREEIGQSATTDNVFPYSFRPFLNVFALLPVDLLQKLATTGGGGTRYRPEVMAAYGTRKDNFGIAVAPGPEDIGGDIHRFSSFAWHLPDNDLCARNNAHVFALYFPEYKKGKGSWDDAPKLNLSEHLLKALGDSTGKSPELARTAMHYVYAVLCSEHFLKEFAGALFHTAGAWPKIPIPTDTDAFRSIADLGRKLALLEKDPASCQLGADLRAAERQLPQDEIELRGFDIEAGTITLEDARGTSYAIDGLPAEVIDLRISGYRIVREWLKWHKKPYLTRTFRPNDGKALIHLIEAIRQQRRIIGEVDSEIERLLSDPTRNLIQPNQA